MNVLEAFEELELLAEASDQYNIPDELKYTKVGGVCPGCHTKFNNAKSYLQHITGYQYKNDKGEYEWVDGCEDALAIMDNLGTMARTKVGKKGHSYDEMTNITAADIIRYKAKHRKCEICGARAEVDADLVYDHAHFSDGSHAGVFRGILCNQCNLLIGQLERNIGKQNPMHYEEYLRNIARYLLKTCSQTTL